MREGARQGAQVWTNLHDIRITNPLVNCYYAGFYTWALRLNANTPYAYSHYGSKPDHPVW